MKPVIDDLLQEATILGMLDEAMTYDEYLDKSPKITKKGKGGTKQGSSDVSIRTALAYKGQKFKNNQTKLMILVKTLMLKLLLIYNRALNKAN